MRIAVWGSAIPSNHQNSQKTTYSGGARGALTEEVLSNIIDDNEQVRAALVSPDGLTRLSGDEERHVSFTIVMAVTDRRILFVAGDDASGEVGADAGSLAYDDLAAVGVDGSDPAVLALSMANGVRWEFPLPDADPAVVDSVVRHLRWVGELRARLVACRNDIELATGEIREHAAAMNWIEAEETYDEIRATLDQLVTAVLFTEPIDDRVLAPELTEMNRTLERAYARLFIERAKSQLELGRQLVENGDYEQAQPVLRTAYGQYVRAEGRADEVKRGDAFQFGEHRELREELNRLEWEIETVAAEPIRQAHEAKITATNADDPATALEHWETAYQRYGDVLTLELGTEDHYFTGNREKVRQELHNAADQLIDRHRRLAREKWNEGRDARADGETKSALRACAVARDHIERAGELASEFQPEFARELEQRRQEMADELYELRESGVVDDPPVVDDGHDAPDTGDTVGESAAAGESAPDEASTEQHYGAAATLAEMDTHHDIELNTAIEGQTADGGRSHEPFNEPEGNKDAGTDDETDFIGPRRADDDEHDDENPERREQTVTLEDADGE